MWVQLPIYDGRYFIDENGLMFNAHTGHFLHATRGQNKYCTIKLTTQKGVIKTFALHRLVAMAFIPNPNNYPLIMHLDNNPSNNHVSNLQWGTHAENTQQAVRDGNLIKHEKDYVLYKENSPVEITIRGIENVHKEIGLSDIQVQSVRSYLERPIPRGQYKGWQLKQPDSGSDNYKVNYVLYNESSPVTITKSSMEEIMAEAHVEHLAKRTIKSHITAQSTLAQGPYKDWRITTVKR